MNIPLYKRGDLVTVKTWDTLKDESNLIVPGEETLYFDNIVFCNQMKCFCDNQFLIDEVRYDSDKNFYRYFLGGDPEKWSFVESFFKETDELRGKDFVLIKLAKKVTRTINAKS